MKASPYHLSPLLPVPNKTMVSVDVKHHVYLPPGPLSPSVPAAAGRQLVIVRAAAYASDSEESL